MMNDIDTRFQAMEEAKMSWRRLICDKRFGLEDYHDNRGGTRSDFQRDFDRLVFSSPFSVFRTRRRCFRCRAVCLCITG